MIIEVDKEPGNRRWLRSVPRLAKEFRDEDHPRDEGGKFTDGDGGAETRGNKIEYGDFVNNYARKAKKEGHSAADTKAWDRYRGNGYVPVNQVLRHGKGFAPNSRWMQYAGFKSDKEVKDHIKKIDDTFSRDSAVLEEDVIVYRGMNWSKLADSPAKLVGSTIYDKGFTSTSASPSIANRFSHIQDDRGRDVGAVMKLVIPRGTRAVPMDAVSTKGRATNTADEKEIILNRGTRFKITGMKMVKGVRHYEARVLKAS